MSQEFISREVISIQEIEDDFFATCSLVSAKWEHMDPNLKSDGIIKLDRKSTRLNSSH